MSLLKLTFKPACAPAYAVFIEAGEIATIIENHSRDCQGESRTIITTKAGGKIHCTESAETVAQQVAIAARKAAL